MPSIQLEPTLNAMLLNAADLAARCKWLGMFKTLFTPVKGFDPALIVECDFSGYARINILAGWAPAAIDSDGNGSCLNTLRTFTKSGATANTDVYGFFYVATDDTTILWGQLFVDGPYPMALDGDLIRITPKIVSSAPVFP